MPNSEELYCVNLSLIVGRGELLAALCKAVALLVSASLSQMAETDNCGEHSNCRLFTWCEKGSAHKS